MSASLFFSFPQVYNSKTRYFFEILTIIGKNSVQTEVKAMLCNDCIIYPDFCCKAEINCTLYRGIINREIFKISGMQEFFGSGM
jgi:hypothetical protein